MVKMMKPTDVFLLTSAEPAHNGIGTIFIRDIITRVTDFKTTWFVEPSFLLKGSPSGRLWFVNAINSLLVRIELWQNLRFYLFLKFKLEQRVAKVEQTFLQSGARVLWVTTSSPEIISIAARLAERGHDLRVTVWDAPEYLLQNLRFSGRNCGVIINFFDRLMSKARSCSVVSDEMYQIYSQRFPSLSLTVMRHGIAQFPRGAVSVIDGPVRFVFAGSLYSKREWNSFVGALELARWRVAGREVKLSYIGQFPMEGAVRPAQLDYFGPLSQDKTMQLMSQMDVGYLPYWLNPAKEFVARTSFPGKMTAYTAVGLSVFHHGPRSSSVTKFLAAYPYGVACDSLDPQVVLDFIERLVKDLRGPLHKQKRQHAMNDALSDTAMLSAFRKLVAVPCAGWKQENIK